MKLTILLLAFVALSAFADDAKHAKDRKDRKECMAAGNAAVAKTPVKSPIEVVKIKNDEIAKCMRLRGYATGPIRAK